MQCWGGEILYLHFSFKTFRNLYIICVHLWFMGTATNLLVTTHYDLACKSKRNPINHKWTQIMYNFLMF